MPTVFVSYRRIDSAAAAGRLYDRLVREFGKARVFMDVEGSIPQGADFPAEITRALASASAFIVVIGRQWMTCTDDRGAPRIAKEDDWVATEVAAAIRRDILVLPVLVDGASMPEERALPPSIAALARKQACDIRASSWDYDFQRIVSTLGPILRKRSRKSLGVAALAGLLAVIVAGTFYVSRTRFTSTNNAPPPSESVAEPSEPIRPQAPRVLVPPGQYTLDFSELVGAEKAPFTGSISRGFSITPESRNWLNGIGYGHPPPYVFFVREASEKQAVSGTLAIAASGQMFLFESVEVYSSVEKTPYVITGFIGARSVFKVAGVVPNTYGGFARVSNTEMATPIDKVSIAVETYTESAIRNPVGLDNIVVSVAKSE